jgi:hypothetical protein
MAEKAKLTKRFVEALKRQRQDILGQRIGLFRTTGEAIRPKILFEADHFGWSSRRKATQALIESCSRRAKDAE